MNKRLHLIALSIATGSALVSSSCAKKGQDEPAPTVETPVGPSISGLVQPADALVSVLLTDDNTQQSIASATLDSKGAYYFNVVPAGTHTLTCNQQTRVCTAPAAERDRDSRQNHRCSYDYGNTVHGIFHC